MNIQNKHLIMGGVAACALTFASCGEKTDSATATSDKDNAAASSANASATEGMETVSLSLSGLQ
jgi:lipopolysaccharide export system protein LptC